jgi:hypothetical protein
MAGHVVSRILIDVGDADDDQNPGTGDAETSVR